VSKKDPNPIDKHVGSRVRMRRMMLGLSQQKLGAARGLTLQQIQKYEKGVNGMRGNRLLQAATVLQVPVNFFFEGAAGVADLPAKVEGDFTTNFLADGCGIELAAAFKRIQDTKARHALLAMAEALAGPERGIITPAQMRRVA
jgi:transcriptional regulator with XRE-family HTH domain